MLRTKIKRGERNRRTYEKRKTATRTRISPFMEITKKFRKFMWIEG